MAKEPPSLSEDTIRRMRSMGLDPEEMTEEQLAALESLENPEKSHWLAKPFTYIGGFLQILAFLSIFSANWGAVFGYGIIGLILMYVGYRIQSSIAGKKFVQASIKRDIFKRLEEGSKRALLFSDIKEAKEINPKNVETVLDFLIKNKPNLFPDFFVEKSSGETIRSLVIDWVIDLSEENDTENSLAMVIKDIWDRSQKSFERWSRLDKDERGNTVFKSIALPVLWFIFERRYDKSPLEYFEKLEAVDEIVSETVLKKIKEVDISKIKGSKVTKEEFAELLVLLTFTLLGDDPLSMFKAPKSSSKESAESLEKLEKRIKNKSEVELRVMEYEMLIFLMFTITQATPEDKIPDEVLDDYSARIYKRLSDSKVIGGYSGLREFEDWITRRYEDYYEALANEAGAGPMLHLGNAVVKNVFNTDDTGVVLIGSLIIASTFADRVKLIKEKMIDRYQIVQ